ncbi:right-handed parallel beta-helix repeat-containing protein [Bifidobacterium oedipodis]|uniref:Polyhydroxyalkanoate depolymerase n=1 Tax=Bifidobacterium oedipodis TaxID=2675322 RepID=A0A7Y0ERM7_9BIFI|nr:right-handed parallel beta-helix repeat-containing protein [Bifidobacterium sp. DSM 109957]NMM95137.1 polyhydroxyalkanoate depolymerase [Bifidobacterium sp. DSM 109957]
MTIYYVSSLTGNDANPGTDSNLPFATLSAVNALTLQPGDQVLLERGSIFQGQYLHPTGSGAPGQPIVIGAYGPADAPLPSIQADGSGVWHQDYHAPIGGAPHKNKGDVSTALLLRDMAWVEVRDLDITNRRIDDADGLAYNDLAVMDRTGVAVIAENAGTVQHVVLERLNVHDVDGNVYNKHMANGGIYMMAHFPTDPATVESNIARFDDVTVRDCQVRQTSRWGIAVGYTAYLNYIDGGQRDRLGQWTNKFDYGDGTIADATIARYGATNVLIEDNVVEDVGGDAITVMYCDRPIIRHNISRRAARQICSDIYSATDDGRVAAAIWPWRCKNALFEYNQAYDTLNAERGNGDGQAWDADYGDGTVYQHNYSSGNTGGTVMFCNEMAVNSVFRHNVARHDLMGAIDIPRNPDAHVHDNVFILGPDCNPLRDQDNRADGVALIERNVFINDEAGAGGDVVPRTANWHPTGSHVTWRDNLFVGFADEPQGN